MESQIKLGGEWELTWWRVEDGNQPQINPKSNPPKIYDSWRLKFDESGWQFSGQTGADTGSRDFTGEVHAWSPSADAAATNHTVITIHLAYSHPPDPIHYTFCGKQDEDNAQQPREQYQGFYIGESGPQGRFMLARPPQK